VDALDALVDEGMGAERLPQPFVRALAEEVFVEVREHGPKR
jgi:hypothetical protein